MRPTIFKLPFVAGKTYTFSPLSCIHAPLGEKDLLKKWVKQIEKDPFAFTLLMGDQFDLARTHYRKHVKSYVEDGSSQRGLDDLIEPVVKELAEKLSPIKEKIVGVLQGNHFWTNLQGISTDQQLAGALGVPFLGVSSCFRIDFLDSDGGTRYSLKVFAHHTGGCRGARRVNTDIAALKRMEETFPYADIYVAGHTHRALSFKQPGLDIQGKGEPKPIARPRAFIRAGTLLKSYDIDHPSSERPYVPNYAEEAAYPASDLGWVDLEINFHQRETKTWQHEFRLSF